MLEPTGATPADQPGPATELTPMPPTGVYALPVVGGPLRQVREVAEGLQPTPEDNLPVTIAKHTVQGALITLAAATAAIVLL